ncbi:hypothetical protein TVAG_051120 [Trichomonas vaginalis G3]|uniref:RRM domain-containing protein n=1 Tax=Trichomonas vaginalis (strain ATCC PRA-98 / G3) TaxID=412133 RepID=A2EES1_TRIV3|nr:RNA-binding domain, RBD family-containing protein [Trichomonas vaginalis G3]EAY08877.1 hypothetical protein TVAG_051120 [Trichomonas vaginalis G3]KAI5489372.1 RNA-binding domain, RBD family-containing protein [Trichomonas vaginalis G3]|eukprot:XP_001321100.1 hypothetical protein [Trichomonas vaginalis G3]
MSVPLFMEPTAFSFSGLPKEYSLDALKSLFASQGDIRTMIISASHENGYVIYQTEAQLQRAFNELNRMEFPPGSGYCLNMIKCSIEEINFYIRLSDSSYSRIDLNEPQTSSDLYNVTRTEPPVFWREKL